MKNLAVRAWLSLVARLVSTSLPGSRTGIHALIQRADTASSLLSQSVALIGSSQLVLLVAHTLTERIETLLRNQINNLGRVVIHVEPRDGEKRA